MKKKKTNLIIVGAIVALIVVVLGIVAVFGFKTPNNSAKHLQAILDHRFKGDTTARAELVSEEQVGSLTTEYEETVQAFVKANVLSGTEADEATEKLYVEQCKKMFASLKYEVTKSKEVGEGKYQVTVEYQPSDFFLKFIEAANAETGNILAKYERSEYRGTEAEINAQMKKEFLENALVRFEETCKIMEHGEKQTMIFNLTRSKDGVYKVNDGEIAEFTVKILRLDEIQD